MKRLEFLKNMQRLTVQARLCLMAIVLLCAFPAAADRLSSEAGAANQVKWKEFFEQLFVWNIEKTARGANWSAAETDNRILKSVYYNPDDFNAVYAKILGIAKQGSTNDAFNARENLLGDADKIRSTFATSKDLAIAWRPGFDPRQNQRLSSFLDLLVRNRTEASSLDSAYFNTEIGTAVQSALKDYLFVVIPGFGSHTMKNYGYAELVEAANIRCGRPLLRPALSGPGIPDGTYQSPAEFHAKQTCGNTPESVGFDVVHPMGNELGNSMGKNLPVAERLAAWIAALPSAYANKKIILLGYSKGSPIAHTMTAYLNSPEGKAKFPGMHERIKFIVTAAGVVQGALPAESGLAAVENSLKELQNLDHTPSVDEVTAFAQQQGANAQAILAPIAGMALGFLGSALENPTARTVFGAVEKLSGVDMKAAFEALYNSLDAENIALILGGVEDMTPYEVVKWDLQNLNDANFAGITIFNLSMLMNIKDFLNPGPVDDFGPTLPPVLVPQMVWQGTRANLDWEHLSLDDIFLHITSVGAFQEAPGGLFDTQVAWPDTKSLLLDQRPLAMSFTPEQMQKLRAEVGLGNTNAAVPRWQLLADSTRHVNFIDLGEYRGSHWDLAFRQVYIPSPEISAQHYNHVFPRKAFLTALVETLAAYELIANSPAGK